MSGQESKASDALAELKAGAEREPIASFLKMRLLELSPGYAKVAIKLTPEHQNFNGLVFGGIVFALSGLSRRRPGHFLSYERNGGAVSISTDAIGEYVGKLATEFPSVIRMRPRVVPGRKSIDVIVDTKVKAGPQIHEVCELLQQRVRETLTEGLGISELGRIEISVSEIVSEHRPS